MSANELKKHILEIQDFPVKGVSFKDISFLIKNRFNESVDALYNLAGQFGSRIDSIAVIEARGFIFGSALAYRMQKGLIMVRKKGKLPPETTSISYKLEYGTDTLEMKKGIVSQGENVLIVDDVYATGETFHATSELIVQNGGNVVGGLFLVDINLNSGRKYLNTIKSVITY